MGERSDVFRSKRLWAYAAVALGSETAAAVLALVANLTRSSLGWPNAASQLFAGLGLVAFGAALEFVRHG